MARRPKLTFDSPQTIADAPLRSSGSGRRPHLEAEGNDFSFAMDDAELNRVPTFVKATPIQRIIPLAANKCIDYEAEEWMREYRGKIPYEGYDIDNPDPRIDTRPNWCQLLTT